MQDNFPGNDDHPFGDVRAGDAFLSQTFRAVTEGKGWKNTVIIFTFDEWGGFFEHVAPPRATAPNALDADLVNGKALLGFRVPTVIASPFTRSTTGQARVNSLVYDHPSALKLIEWLWGLGAPDCTGRIERYPTWRTALDFQKQDHRVPNLPAPTAPFVPPCFATGAVTARPKSWNTLRDSGLLDGWPVRG